MKKIHLVSLLAVTSVLLFAAIASAEMLTKIKTSGMVIKDTLEVHAYDDPNIEGVTCYVTLPKRSLSLVDQTNTSISCRKTGVIKGAIKSQKQIFRAKKSWLIKSMYVDRVYDSKRNVLVYVSYTKKLSGDNASNSVSVVVLDK